MTESWDTLAWSGRQLGEALPALARASGLTHRTSSPIPPPPLELLGDSPEAWNTWLEDAADWLGLEAESVGAIYPEVARMLAGAGPALVRISEEGPPRFLLLLKGHREHVELLAPDLRRVRVPMRSVHHALCQLQEATREAYVRRLLETAEVPAGELERVRAALLLHQLRARWIGGCWLLRYPPGASFWSQVKQRGLHVRGALFVLAQLAVYVGWLLSWWMMGRGALRGQLDGGWLLGWALLLMTLVPLRMCCAWTAGRLSLEGAGLLKQRLLAGALLLEPDEIREEGAGQLLSRVLEAEAVESLASGGGIQAVLAVIELLLAAAVLGAGAGGTWHLVLLGATLGLSTWLGVRYWKLRTDWTAQRLQLTHELSERMQGHRTRLVQERLEEWHQGEDQSIERYLDVSRRMDRQLVMLTTFVPRAWLVLGLLGLIPALLGREVSAPLLAVSVGGVLLARQALQRAGLGLSRSAGAVIAWRAVNGMFRAASRLDGERAPGMLAARAPRTSSPGAPATVLEMKGLTYRHRGRGRPVLQGVSLSLKQGDRVLLEGPSGSGKSTLASVLSGVRAPESGLLLSHGLDRVTLGPRGWRRRVVSAPQFHENYVLSAPFAFNLLMGRGWPAAQADLLEAEEICRELDLGGLLDRMPGGILQVVGETGWQLSHGERSRLYIGRALLQKADLVLLDESFAALDPITLKRVMDCVLRRTSTLVVIAHP
jgi:ATP-binding cassette subfamily B protein